MPRASAGEPADGLNPTMLIIAEKIAGFTPYFSAARAPPSCNQASATQLFCERLRPFISQPALQFPSATLGSLTGSTFSPRFALPRSLLIWRTRHSSSPRRFASSTSCAFA